MDGQNDTCDGSSKPTRRTAKISNSHIVCSMPNEYEMILLFWLGKTIPPGSIPGDTGGKVKTLTSYIFCVTSTYSTVQVYLILISIALCWPQQIDEPDGVTPFYIDSKPHRIFSLYLGTVCILLVFLKTQNINFGFRNRF